MIVKNASLKLVNTFGVDASAAYFATFDSVESLTALLSHDDIRQLPVLVLGGGSNLLFTKDYPGFVLQNTIKGIHVEREDADHVYLRVGAGEAWHPFVMHCVSQGLGGVENLSLIPGTVGAAPIQNIGAYGVELSSVFVELQALNLSDHSLQTFSHSECQFGYRDSIFKTSHKGQYVILSVLFRLTKSPTLHLDYGAIRETLSLLKRDALTINDVSDAVIHIRRSKLPDPSVIGNAGSFFKNPVISASQFKLLQNTFPTIPHFTLPNSDDIKINAGWLIEQCGWKGKRIAHVGAYDKQALIIVNHGNATGAEIYDFAMQIQADVNQRFGVMLEPEVNLV